MKKIALLLIVAFVAASCGSSANQDSAQTEQTAAKPAIPVSVQTLAAEKFDHYIELTGTIEAQNIAFISPEAPGQIKKIFVKEGDRVMKDQVLAELNTSVIKNQIKQAETQLELAEIVFKKQKNLWDQKIGSEIDYLTAKNNFESLESNIETLKSNLELLIIKAPFDGIIDDVILKEGELANPGAQLMQMVNLNKLYINADLAENYLAAVKKGDKVEVSFPSFPDMNMVKPIYRIGSIIHPMNRTVNVQLKVDNKKEILKPNGLAIIKINDFSEEAAIVVPSIIVKQDNRGSFLYVATKNGTDWTSKKRYVETGRTYMDKSMIINGLKAGEKVIVKGFTQITDGSTIQISK
ncbi:MAG: hypothetical protein CL663_06900 [Bacteroidetes bacterium]|nr:hypothetical protein [Bacteroidota bacterium]